MAIIYKTGDLFASNERVLVHGCNAQGAYSSGFAGIMREHYPEAYQGYCEAYDKGELRLGEVIWVTAHDGRVIGNAITQETYGRDKNVVYADYQAIRWAMREINLYVAGQYDSVGMPAIGAGLANGSWATISQIIEEEATQFTPVVYLLDGRMPAG
jgi:O-acetyl-ADP-ribose deacetylase (regulator of RNase III)